MAAPEPNLKHQIHSLRHEIADRSAEIQRLEQLAKGVRSSYLNSNNDSSPRFPTRQNGVIVTPLSPTSPSTNGNGNGVDENRLGVRSPSTSKMINTLQKEMDALKASSEAARAAADAERASREAIQRKCDKLEEIVEVLRMENSNMNGLLTRKERVMKQEVDLRKTLEQNFSTLEKEKSTLQNEVQAIQSRLTQVENLLSTETLSRQKSDIEYAALRSQVNASSERSRTDLAALRAGIQQLKAGRREDARTMGLMAAEIDRLGAEYAKEREMAAEITKEVEKVKEKQRLQFERAIKSLKKEVEEQVLGNQENVSRTGEALAELRALNGKIRAVDPDYR